jgi:phage N-6-adenine-methyltransferase
MTDTATAVLEPVKADTNDRRTPAWFLAQCQRRYGRIAMDAAAIEANAVSRYWYGPGSPFAVDALGVPWPPVDGIVWLNPPYGPPGTIEKWIAKARQERDAGARVLMLLPADTSTRWYHDVTRTELCELVPFRLAFDAPDGSTKGNSAKFGSVLVWIAPTIQRPKRKAT